MKSSLPCPKCGNPLPEGAPQGLCPRCLMAEGLSHDTQPSASPSVADTQISDHSPSPPGSNVMVTNQIVRELPKPGDLFGGYRVGRELGRGGMGAVFEAEHLESGRRVALKVLGHQLDSASARARFLREGRLAASINHPNSVYVYGTEEIAGTPIIAMELIAGGTLQERVQRQGPLPVGQAVDAVLQIIAGLEAAQAIGILHRDIKPANCFEDADGTVKVGDFGLSISTAARGDTNITLQGAFLGTPAFASPEQLRGEELNLRSDMYSVGVTLYYLLTGHTPFEAKDMVQLLAAVLEKPAPSPKKHRPEIPLGLAKIILRCLEKQAGERFKNYDELRQALAPYSSAAPVPASLGLRFVAGILDLMLISGSSMAIGLMVMGDLAAYTNPASYRSPKMLAFMGVAFLVYWLYFSLLEGWFGASAGKAVLGLRVVGKDRNPPGLPRALVRSLIYLFLPPLPMWMAMGFSMETMMSMSSSPARIAISFSYYVILALLFATARKRNGYASVHDWLTGTRVIRRAALLARPVLPASEEVPPVTETLPKIGPYHVLESLEKTAAGEWLMGYDTRLLRKVLIRVLPPDTAPVAAPLRHLGRVGRLRWITGRRGPAENWDAYEGVTGKPLVVLLNQPQPWSLVRFWLHDLAAEIAAAEKDHTLPAVLALDRVWITANGRAKLLDFPAPGTSPNTAPATEGLPPIADTRHFLNQFTLAVLQGNASARSGPIKAVLPLYARKFLAQLPELPSVEFIETALKPLLRLPATVSRWRRAGLVIGCVAFPLVAALGCLFGMRVLEQWQRRQPDIKELAQVLSYRMAMHFPWMKSQPGLDDRHFAIYIASHFRTTITNASSWNTLYAISTINRGNRQFAEQSLRDHPNPTAQEIQAADAAITPILFYQPEEEGMVKPRIAQQSRPELAPNQQAKGVVEEVRSPLPTPKAGPSTELAAKPRQPNRRVEDFVFTPWMSLVVLYASLLMYVGFPAFLCALAFRGGLVLRLLGVAVVRQDGLPASRWRVLWRCVVAWSPLFLAPVLLALLTPLIGIAAAAGCLSLLILGLTVWSLQLPDRSLQDRLAGTCLVPR